jgi:hypothetical protein
MQLRSAAATAQRGLFDVSRQADKLLRGGNQDTAPRIKKGGLLALPNSFRMDSEPIVHADTGDIKRQF